MKRFLISFLILAVVVLGFGVLEADAHRGLGQGNNYNNRQEQSNILNLEEEQLERIEEFRDEFFDIREDLVEELQDKRIELREAILEDEADTVISTIESEINSLQNKINSARVEYQKNMKEVLNEEQINMILENDYRIGLNSGFGYGSNHRSQMLGSKFMHFQGSSFRSFNRTDDRFRTPRRINCY